MHPTPWPPLRPPPVDRSLVRPPTWWYWIAGGVATAATLAAIVMLVVAVSSSPSSTRPDTRSVPAGTAFTLDLESDTVHHVLVQRQPGTLRPRVSCDAGPDVTVVTAKDRETRHRDGERYERVLALEASRTGEHTVLCTVDDPDAGLLVEESPYRGAAEQFDRSFLLFLGSILTGLTGTLAGGVIAIVVATRRATAVRRLRGL